jgi:hypothetical protein
MPLLTQLPNLVGFFSYSRTDDKTDDGAVSALANRIYVELLSQLGRKPENFKLWRDVDALRTGDQWKEKLQDAVSESVFFIMMVSPSALNSGFCRFEFESFVERERQLGRNDLVFPVLYVPVPELEGNQNTSDPVISIVAARQYADWRGIRHLDVKSPEVRQTVGQFCAVIARKLRTPWLSPEEIEAQRQAEDQRRREEAELKRQKEEERQEAQRQAEAERLRKQAERVEQKRREKEERERQKQQALEARRKADEDKKKAANSASEVPLWVGLLYAAAAVIIIMLITWLVRH